MKEIYVISNRDLESMRFLDQWLNYIDTEEVLPLHERLDVKYTISKLENTDWNKHSALIVAVVRDNNLAQLRLIDSMDDLQNIFDLLKSHNEKMRLREVFNQTLTFLASGDICLDLKLAMSFLLDYLPQAIYLIPTFLQSQMWNKHKKDLKENLTRLAPTLLRELILSENELGGFVRFPFELLLQEMSRISIQDFGDLVELISLTFRSAESTLDLLLGTLEPEVPRLIVGRPAAIRQFAVCLFGIALDHVDEASSHKKATPETIRLSFEDHKDGFTIVKSIMRVDSPMNRTLATGDHLRLTVSNPPENAPFDKASSMDVLVLNTEAGSISLRCIHKPPAHLEECAWTVTHCGSFVTTKTALDAVTAFFSQRQACCRIYDLLVGLPDNEEASHPEEKLPIENIPTLNESQNAALAASMTYPLTFIWGPPGTGKTHTVVVILTQLLKALPDSRFLVTAPTHNAVDNLLRRFISDHKAKQCGVAPVRVSTQLSKVAQDLRSYTVDMMLGKDLTANLPARRKAQKRIHECRLIFTTCISAGLGLLRTEDFDVVIVDEASQQTEPATLVPLVKGCSRAILVGDHVQLRATVQQNAVLVGYDVSLFERHYDMPTRKAVAKIMLDTQYRMHQRICDFSSGEFYNNELKTAVPDDTRSLPPSSFPWPTNKRLVWIECASTEDLGRQSKANMGQVELCKRVVQLLHTTASTTTAASSSSAPVLTPSIAILTPYTRQKEALISAISNAQVSSIDGFQGQEADIVVFVTVRCNAHCDMGFLTDMRRLNVVMTRAKTGVIVIGNRNTLTGTASDVGEIDESKRVWQRLFERCTLVEVPTEAS